MLEAAFASSRVHWTRALARSWPLQVQVDTQAGRCFGERAGMGICVKPTANKVALTATGAATRARRGDMRWPVAKPEPHWHVAAFQLDPQQWQWL
jgi:hypothetical protein